MIDDTDTRTMTIPGVSPLPASRLRLNAQERREAMGYQEPKARDSCRHCVRCSVVVLWSEKTQSQSGRCHEGNLDVHLGGWCPMFVRRRDQAQK